MKLILLQNIKNVGKKYDVTEVKNGYGSFLVASKQAIIFSNKKYEQIKKIVFTQNNKYLDEIRNAQEIKNEIEKLNLIFLLKANNGSAFGSISIKQIILELNKHNISLEKSMFFDGNKTYGLGNHKIQIKLHNEVSANLSITVNEEK